MMGTTTQKRTAEEEATMALTYGSEEETVVKPSLSSGEDTYLLQRQKVSNSEHEWQEVELQQQPPPSSSRQGRTTTQLLLVAILVVSSYLVVLGHTILSELRGGGRRRREGGHNQETPLQGNILLPSQRWSKQRLGMSEYPLPVSKKEYYSEVVMSNNSNNGETTSNRTMVTNIAGGVVEDSSHSMNDYKDQKDDDDDDDENPQQPPQGHQQQKHEEQVIILIVHGPDGDPYQEAMSQYVANGVLSISNTIVLQESITTATFDQLLVAHGIIIGSSVENGNTHHHVQQWINDHWDMQYRNDIISSHKVGAAFVTAGGISAGEEGTLHHLLQSMLIFGILIVGGNDWMSSFGASAITYESPFTPYPPSSSESESSSSSSKSSHAMNNKDDNNNNNIFFDDVCYNYHGNVVHPMFLSKAYGLGVRVATIAKQLNKM